MSNTNLGRHGAGSAIAKSGFKPKPRTGARTGSFVGTGVNNKTAAAANYQGSQPRSGTDSQPESFVNQAPSPFDNSQPSSNPRSYKTSTTVSPKGYEATAGQRAGSGGYGKQPQANMNAASVGAGKGQEKGKVIGKSQPRRVGNVFNQPKASFYGR